MTTQQMKLFAKKSLGQHFLNSTHVLDQIISAAHIQKGEIVLEIGPGTGVLTRALLTAGANVVAIEKDQRAVGMLEQDFFNEIKENRLEIISGDVLDPDILNSNINLDSDLRRNDSARILPSTSIKNNSYALVANIPYYITGAILEKFLEHEPRPNRMVLLVQKEVAERIVAHDKKESILSISVKAFGTPKIIARVPPGAFTPPPTVDSAILSISNISDKLFSSNSSKNVDIPSDITRFFSIVKAGFAHKRKFVTRNLEAVLSKSEIENIWEKLKLNPKLRAEDMTVEQWVNISAS
jgi:16S rRNA (adenine1518-N6/adenine1519-N6)-dimethyltransferase